MPRLVECVPNFSEGRDRSRVDAIVARMAEASGVRVLDVEMDAGHNRAVVTLAGAPEPVAEAAFRGVAAAAELIDLNHHRGEHPRMGACDVLPFIPVTGVTMDDCVALARQVGERIGTELAIPVFLYEAAATRPERTNLADVRKGQFEGLREAIGTDPARDPDFGPRAIHPTAGAIAVGARDFLVAYNVYLGTKDVAIAKKIANAIRFQTGGLRYVKALGFEIKERGQVQVSMNLVNTKGSPIHRVMALIRFEAERYGVPLAGSEVVGLIPMDALIDVAEHHIGLENFSRDQILERRLWGEALGVEAPLADYLDEVAGPSSAPGGGSVSALLGALGAALAGMVANLTASRKKYAEVHEEMREIQTQATVLRASLSRLVEEDTRAYRALVAAGKLPGGTPELDAARTAAQLRATVGATEVPLRVMALALDVGRLARRAFERGLAGAASDAGVALLAAHAAFRGARLNVLTNLQGFEDAPERERLIGELAAREREAAEFFPSAEAAVEARFAGAGSMQEI
jgi:glutamate formiminotransferase/formiminotetrahydrofolate cyclodeaminase